MLSDQQRDKVMKCLAELTQEICPLKPGERRSIPVQLNVSGEDCSFSFTIEREKENGDLPETYKQILEEDWPGKDKGLSKPANNPPYPTIKEVLQADQQLEASRMFTVGDRTPLPLDPADTSPYAAVKKVNFKSSQQLVIEVRRMLMDWINKQGHDKCWYYPEIFQGLCKLLGCAPEQLPDASISQADFEKGCQRFQQELYKADLKAPSWPQLTDKVMQIERLAGKMMDARLDLVGAFCTAFGIATLRDSNDYKVVLKAVATAVLDTDPRFIYQWSIGGVADEPDDTLVIEGVKSRAREEVPVNPHLDKDYAERLANSDIVELREVTKEEHDRGIAEMEIAAADKARCLKEGLTPAVEIPAGDSRLRINGQPLKRSARLVSEGQYQALVEVWMQAGHTVVFPHTRSPEL